MKILAFVYLLFIGGALIYSWAKYPIMKMLTDMAVSAIEERFIRDDLSPDEKEAFDSYAQSISWNQRGLSRAWENASASMLWLFGGTLLLNLVNIGCLVRSYFKKRRAKSKQGEEADAAV